MNILYVGPYKQKDSMGMTSQSYIKALMSDSNNNITTRPIFLNGTSSEIDQDIMSCEKSLYDLFTKNIRGGLCNAVKNYSRAYNKFVPDYDEKNAPMLYNHKTGKVEPMQVFLTYLDATSMYAGIMRKKLPLSDIKSIMNEKEKFEKLSDMEYLKTIDCNGFFGYAYL
jgi:hypothetical protein